MQTGQVKVTLLTGWPTTWHGPLGMTASALFQFGPGLLSAMAVGWAMVRFQPTQVISSVPTCAAGVFAGASGQSLDRNALPLTRGCSLAACASTAHAIDVPSLQRRAITGPGHGVSWIARVLGRLAPSLSAWFFHPARA